MRGWGFLLKFWGLGIGDWIFFIKKFWGLGEGIGELGIGDRVG